MSACCDFMEAGRRNESPESETLGFITHIIASCPSISLFGASPPSCSSDRMTWRRPRNICACTELCYRRRQMSLETVSLTLNSKHACRLVQRDAVFEVSKKACLLFRRETLSLSSKADCYTNILQNMVQNKGSQGLCSKDVQKHKRPIENHLPMIVAKIDHMLCYQVNHNKIRKFENIL